MGVVVDNTFIDLTIAQLNDAQYQIEFRPNFLTLEADQPFLEGKRWLIAAEKGLAVCYRAYPCETSYVGSESWSNPSMLAELRDVAEAVSALYEGKDISSFHAEKS